MSVNSISSSGCVSGSGGGGPCACSGSAGILVSPPKTFLKWSSAVKESELGGFALIFDLIDFQNFFGCFFCQIANSFTFLNFLFLFCLAFCTIIFCSRCDKSLSVYWIFIS